VSLTSLIALCIFLSLFLGALIDPLLGIIGYLCVYLLINPWAWWCRPITEFISRPSLIAMIVLILGCIIHCRKLNWHVTKKEVAFYLFALTAWVVTNYFGVLMDEGTIKFLTKTIKMFVFLFFFFRVVYTWKSVNIVIWTMILCGVFLAYQGHVSGDINSGRLESIGGNDFTEANQLGAFLMANIIFIGFKIFQFPLWKKVPIALSIALMFNAFILTQSRAVFIGIFLGQFVPVFKIPKIYRKQFSLYYLLAVVMFLILASDSFIERMGTVNDSVGGWVEKDALFINERPDRLDFWITSISIFKDYPMGVGVNNFANIVPSYDPRNPGMDPHNTYVLCYSELGIIGISLFLYIILKTILEIKNIHKLSQMVPFEDAIRLTAISLSVIYIIYGLGSMMTHSILYTEILWILLSLSTCLETALKNEIVSGK